MSSRYMLGSAAVAATCASLALYMNTLSTPSDGALFSKFTAPIALTLDSVEQINHDTKRFRFALPENTKAGFPVASALLSISRPSGAWLPTLRPYSPISSPSQNNHIEFLIKKYPSGKASSHFHNLSQGDKVYFAGPIKGPRWTANTYEHVTLIAGGTGLTPCYQLLQHIFSDPNDKTAVTLVHGINTDSDVLLAQELQSFQDRFPQRLNVVRCVSNPSKDCTLRSGRIDLDALRDALQGRDVQAGRSAAYICGPPAMEAAIKGSRSGNDGILRQLGYDFKHVFSF